MARDDVWAFRLARPLLLRDHIHRRKVSSGANSLHPDHVRPFRAPMASWRLSIRRWKARPASFADEMCYMHGLTVGEDESPVVTISAAGREAIGNAMATQEHSGNCSRMHSFGGLLKMPGHLADDARRKTSWMAGIGRIQAPETRVKPRF